METRPLSKTKNWRLLRIVTKAATGGPTPAEIAPVPTGS
jgi:hypothetical protein